MINRIYTYFFFLRPPESLFLFCSFEDSHPPTSYVEFCVRVKCHNISFLEQASFSVGQPLHIGLASWFNQMVDFSPFPFFLPLLSFLLSYTPWPHQSLAM